MGYPEITVPPGMWKVHNAAAASMAAFSTEHSQAVGGFVLIASAVPRGRGMGSSTADVTATIRAVANFHGVTPYPPRRAATAVPSPSLTCSRIILFGTVSPCLLFPLPLPRVER